MVGHGSSEALVASPWTAAPLLLMLMLVGMVWAGEAGRGTAGRTVVPGWGQPAPQPRTLGSGAGQMSLRGSRGHSSPGAETA